MRGGTPRLTARGDLKKRLGVGKYLDFGYLGLKWEAPKIEKEVKYMVR